MRRDERKERWREVSRQVRRIVEVEGWVWKGRVEGIDLYITYVHITT